MVANVRGYTPNYEFRLINFDTPRWHTLEYANWNQLDTMLLSAGIAQVRGEWAHSTTYRVGDRVIDGENNQLYRCLVEHNSPASGTFAQYRIANPTHWTLQLPGTPVYRAAWAPNNVYSLGDIVFVNAYQYYLCDEPHTSSATFPPDAGKWQLIWDVTTAVNTVNQAVTNAQTAETNAETAETNAETAETNAEIAQGKAEDAAAQALQYQSNASGYAEQAKDARDLALEYKDDAEAAVIAANGSAVDAGNYATSASGSANEAAASANALMSANAFPWLFDPSTVMADPNWTRIRLNNAALNLVTQIAISSRTQAPGNPDVTSWIMSWDDSNGTIKGQLIIRENASPENFAIYNVVGAITVNGSAGIVPVAYVTHSGGFATNDVLNVEFTRSGNDGTSGSGSGDMLKSENLAGLASYPTARSNMGLGTTDAPVFNGMTLTAALVLPAAAPTLGTHAANKTYVDGRVADTGDTMTGDLIITSPTVSAGTTTGALQVTGGVGVQGRMNVGGQFIAKANNVINTIGDSAVAGYGLLRINGSNNVDSSPVLSLYRSGILEAAFSVAPGTSPQTIYLSTALGGFTDAALATAAKFSWTHPGVFTAMNNVASTDVNTGSIVSKGGLGVTGSANIGGTLSTTGVTNALGGINATASVGLNYASPILILNKPASGQNAILRGSMANNGRWDIYLGDDTAEDASNNGSRLVIYHRNNAGGSLGAALVGERATGLFTVKADPTAALGIATKQYVDSKASINKPAFIASSNATQSVLNEAWTKCNFATAPVNQGGYYNTTNSRWTPPAGTVRLSSNIYFTAGLLMGTSISIGFYKNGALSRQVSIGVNATYGGATGTILDICSGTDYYEVFCYIFTGTNATYANTGTLCSFYGEMI